MFGTANNDNTSGFIDSLKRYLSLYADYMRLSAAEKMSMLLSAVAFYTLIVAMALIALIFLSIGVGFLLASVMTLYWAFFIVTAFYILIFSLLIIFRHTLIVDPIARFVSRLLVKPPKASEQ